MGTLLCEAPPTTVVQCRGEIYLLCAPHGEELEWMASATGKEFSAEVDLDIDQSEYCHWSIDLAELLHDTEVERRVGRALLAMGTRNAKLVERALAGDLAALQELLIDAATGPSFHD